MNACRNRKAEHNTAGKGDYFISARDRLPEGPAYHVRTGEEHNDQESNSGNHLQPFAESCAAFFQAS